MLNNNVCSLLNDQINKEFYSEYFYLDISIFYEKQGLSGFANWFRIQAEEERAHALLFISYIQQNGGDILLASIDSPNRKYAEFIDPLIATLEHEKYVTNLINSIYDSAYNIKDFRTMQFLDWFVKEQGEEEKVCEDLIKKYTLFGSDAKGLYSIDAELGKRVYVKPSLVV